MPIKHKRATNDTTSLLSIQLTSDGTPIDLTGKTVTFDMYTLSGVNVINDGSVIVPDAEEGYVDYDFPSGLSAGVYKGFFEVEYSGEKEVWPPDDDGIEITIFDIAGDTTEPEPSIDIIEMANAPARTRTVEGTVEERSIHELIKADQYQASKAASDLPPWGIRIARVKPGGTTT